MFIENKYFRWYNSIVQKAKDRTNNFGYQETHHIIPRSLGGTNDANNLVKLTAKEHFICHLLLTKMTSGNARYKMIFAVVAMSRTSNNQERYKVNSKLFESLKKQKKHTLESRKKMSISATGKKQTLETIEKRVAHLRGKESPIKGKSIHSDQSKQKISDKQKQLLSTLSAEEKAARTKKSWSGPKSWTDSRKEKISKALTGIIRSTETREKISIANKNRSTEQKLSCGDKNRGKTWRLVEGKRVWFSRENQHY